MKQDSHDARKLAALLKRLKSRYKPEPPPPRHPVLQMVVAFLQWEATRKQAEQALGRVMEVMVDVNDLRVSLDHEILGALGEDYPRARERIARMRESLNEIYRREHHVEMRSIASKSKKEQRAYLDTLPGITPYVAAQVMLLSFGGHAMPVDSKLAALLASEDIVPADALPEQVESILTRHIRADDNLEAHLLLQAWQDDRKAPAAVGAGSASSSGSKTRSRTTKKTTKRPTKRTTKKTTKRTTASTRRAKKK